jgi:hypothetical protein
MLASSAESVPRDSVSHRVSPMSQLHHKVPCKTERHAVGDAWSGRTSPTGSCAMGKPPSHLGGFLFSRAPATRLRTLQGIRPSDEPYRGVQGSARGLRCPLSVVNGPPWWQSLPVPPWVRANVSKSSFESTICSRRRSSTVRPCPVRTTGARAPLPRTMRASSWVSFCWACALSAQGSVDHAFGRGLLMGDELAMPLQRRAATHPLV